MDGIEPLNLEEIDQFYGYMTNLIPLSMYFDRTEEEEDELQNATYIRVLF